MRYLWERRQKNAVAMLVHVSLFCLILQPFSGMSVHALNAPSIIINEFSANGAEDWVELYNLSSEPVDVTGWELRDSTTVHIRSLTGAIPGRGFLVVELSNWLNIGTDTIRLFDTNITEVASLTYATTGEVPYPGLGQSTARAWDGGPAWAKGEPTKGASNDTQAPAAPGSGMPHAALQASLAFSFSWDATMDPQGSEVAYQMRGSYTEADLHEAGQTNAWYSGYLVLPSLDASAIANLRDGTWYWQVRARDATGNVSGWSNSWQVTIDTEHPEVSIVKPVSDSVYGSADVVEFAALITERQLSHFSVELDAVDRTTEVVRTQRGMVVDLSAFWNGLTKGYHTVRVRATDTTGRSQEKTRTFEIDKTAPILTSSLRQGSVNKGIVSLDVASSAPDVASLDVSITSETGERIPLARSEEIEDQTQKMMWEWDTTQVQDGVYTIRFTGVDRVGNEASLVRIVRVANMITGGLGAVLKDPLLEQLSVALSQPFTSVLTSPLTTASPSIKIPAEHTHPIPEEDLAAPIDLQLPPVAATENGWRVFGVLWYWWLCAVLLVGGLGTYSWRVLKRRQLTSELDSA